MEKFIKYCADFGKSYINRDEFALRLRNWKRTEKFIQSKAWDARSHYKVGHNKFSDWTQAEYEKLLGYALPMEKKAKSYETRRNSSTVADSIDWTDQGYAGNVQDQGMCASDWAFACNGAVQGAFAVQ